MGCCQSTDHTLPIREANPFSAHYSKEIHGGNSKSPPPTTTEEETVKEVVISDSRFVDHQNGAVVKKPFAAFGNGEVLSEIRSTLDENVSVNSTTTTEIRAKYGNREGDDELRRRSPARLKNRLFSGEVKREDNARKSPGRGPGPDPRPGDDKRSDSGEGSGRRLRAPFMYTDSWLSNTCHEGSQSSRKTGRVGSGLSERIGEGRDTWAPTSYELLENPPISLECFIFL